MVIAFPTIGTLVYKITIKLPAFKASKAKVTEVPDKARLQKFKIPYNDDFQQIINITLALLSRKIYLRPLLTKKDVVININLIFIISEIS
jgi:hypothetical protein